MSTLFILYLSCFFVSLLGIYLTSEYIHFSQKSTKDTDFIPYEEHLALLRFKKYATSFSIWRTSTKEIFQKKILFISKIIIVVWMQFSLFCSEQFKAFFGKSIKEIEHGFGNFFLHNYDDYKKRLRRFKRKIKEEARAEENQNTSNSI